MYLSRFFYELRVIPSASLLHCYLCTTEAVN
jgi:hypothetical protein